MKVVVEYRGKEYTYSQVGKITTWTDDDNKIIPVMLHSILREKALSSGADPSIFLSKKKCKKTKTNVAKDAVSVKSRKRKSTLDGFNPFK